VTQANTRKNLPGGFDHVTLFVRFGDLVRHIHFKDLRADRPEDVWDKDMSLNAAMRMGMVIVPGDGLGQLCRRQRISQGKDRGQWPEARVLVRGSAKESIQLDEHRDGRSL
jgi:hypothetical protein